MNEDSSAMADVVRRHRRRVVVAMVAGALLAGVLMLLGWTWVRADAAPEVVEPTPAPVAPSGPLDAARS